MFEVLMSAFDTTNELFILAADLVNHSSENIFLTGKAGTGKTTFLKYIRESCAKQIAVVAPTGVAAINAGGTTIHSFFQLPFTPFIPVHSNSQDVNSRHTLLERIKMTNERRKVLQALELLIIDEISMVRCDILDAIDAVLRHFRNKQHEPFGGVQLLLIGDMYQLPPVIKNEEWSLLSPYYNNQYFFSGKAMEADPPVYISFEKIYRQTEESFINVLNKVRNNDMDEDAMETLHKRYQPQFNPANDEGYIVLTTHNNKADAKNYAELNKLKTKGFSFKAIVEGDFYEKSFPAEEILQLKEGAQVMFIKNDSEKVKRYYNGKIGTVTKIDDESIFVQCKDENEAIEVSKEKWENIRYTVDKNKKNIEEEVVGSFTQFPLRLAWAITIHKSQGLTFEKAIIDAGAAFAPGQVYVALSRCTNIAGVVLHSRINQNSLHADERIHSFSQNKASLLQLNSQLISAKHQHQQKILFNVFEFDHANILSAAIGKILNDSSSFNEESKTWADETIKQIDAVNEVAKKFTPHLQLFFSDTTLPQENILLQTRIAAASKYFVEHLQNIISHLQKTPAVTDSRILAKEFNEAVHELFLFIAEKKFQFTLCEQGFKATEWHRDKKNFKLPAFNVNAYAGAASYKESNVQHPILYRQLRDLRDKICSKNDTPIYLVANSATLNELVNFLPQTRSQLEKISGFGKVKVNAYGDKFLEIINNYCEENNLSSSIELKVAKRQRKEKNAEKTDTKSESFKLFKEGKSISEIAAIRNFTIQTIEGHLATYVQRGEIQISELLSKEKLLIIEPVLNTSKGESVTTIKNKLGNEISFGEIKLVSAWKEFEKSVS
ncbi:helix-turn-helix domain-containing protein [soil metagenome]